eukprot:5548591-Alexandrium_andersonii.AAC.1
MIVSLNLLGLLPGNQTCDLLWWVLWVCLGRWGQLRQQQGHHGPRLGVQKPPEATTLRKSSAPRGGSRTFKVHRPQHRQVVHCVIREEAGHKTRILGIQ